MVTQRIYRSRTDHMVSGVCGGLGQYFAIDSTLIRLSFVVGTLLTSGVLIVLYAAMWLIISEEPSRLSGTMTGGFAGSESPDPSMSSDPFGTAESSYTSGSAGGSLGFSSPRDLSERQARRHRYLGWLMVVLGVLVLSANLHLLSWLQLGVTWPVFLVLAGVLLLFRRRPVG